MARITLDSRVLPVFVLCLSLLIGHQFSPSAVLTVCATHSCQYLRENFLPVDNQVLASKVSTLALVASWAQRTGMPGLSRVPGWATMTTIQKLWPVLSGSFHLSSLSDQLWENMACLDSPMPAALADTSTTQFLLAVALLLSYFVVDCSITVSIKVRTGFFSSCGFMALGLVQYARQHGARYCVPIAIALSSAGTSTAYWPVMVFLWAYVACCWVVAILAKCEFKSEQFVASAAQSMNNDAKNISASASASESADAPTASDSAESSTAVESAESSSTIESAAEIAMPIAHDSDEPTAPKCPQTASGPTKSKTQLKKERRLAAQAAAEAAALAAQADVEASGDWQTVPQKGHQRSTSTPGPAGEQAASTIADKRLHKERPGTIKASRKNLYRTGSHPNKPSPHDFPIGSSSFTSTKPQTLKPAPLNQASSTKMMITPKTWAVTPSVQPSSAVAANTASLNTAEWPSLAAA